MPAINPAQAVAMGNRRSRRGVEGIAIESFASHPAGLRLPRARLCAAQPSPPFFFVFPRCVRVLPSLARSGLGGNSASIPLPPPLCGRVVFGARGLLTPPVCILVYTL